MRLFIIFLGCVGFAAIPRLITPAGFPRLTTPTAIPRPITPAARLAAAPREASTSPGVQSAMDYFTTQSRSFAASCTQLRKTLETPVPSPAFARQQLIDCRCQYKKIEAFLEYFFRSSSTIYNRPPKFEAEEPDMEYQSPIGLQVIESLLYETHPDQKNLLDQAKAIESSASDLPALLYGFKASDQQLLESLRLELIRIIALDITGYEAPLLKTGIRESRAALEALSQSLQPYMQEDRLHNPQEDRLHITQEDRLHNPQDARHGNSPADSLQYFLHKTISLLKDDQPFDTFDRLSFLKDAALPLQRQLNGFIREKGLELNTSKALNYAAGDIFSFDAILPAPGALPTTSEASAGTTTASGPASSLIILGNQLFSDPSLSTDNKKSCASCHDPKRSFTDGLPSSLAFDGHNHLDRNAPTLLYSGFQYNQFWDGRARTLEDQIRAVLNDAKEINADTASLTKHGGIEKTITALAAYVRSLHPMNSRFDQYLRGKTTLTEREKAGANLFMGKAQCATCHFIPLFNGLIPPYYTQTEFEVLGTTQTDNFSTTLTGTQTSKAAQSPATQTCKTARSPVTQTSKAAQSPVTQTSSIAKTSLQLSPDQGRYKIYPFPFYKGAFKTPTVRNSAQTGPYMHNGAFHSLETVLDFYNKGGGAGLGLNVPDQTLSPMPLHLSTQEMNNIILFIHTLTDSLNSGLNVDITYTK
ncbi:MAG TPA: cytochrome c peroxidase [Puia sp.]|nr:cytochrome c peroxidase [Puia sp.]